MSVSTKLYKTISQLILVELKSGRYAVGDRIPTERELATAYSVSRNTIREALIALESKGWIEITQGRGVEVLRTASESPLVFADSEIGSFKLLEARRLIEGEICALAAISITPAEIKRLEQLLEEMKSTDREIAEKADREFHVTVARATENEAMIAMVETLWDWRYWSASARQLLVDMVHDGAVRRVVEHAAILDALKSRSAANARKAMRDHLDQVRDQLLAVVEENAIRKIRDANLQRAEQFRDRATKVDVQL